MALELTPERVAKSISAAYDSVDLITALKSKKKPTAEEVEILDSNKKHIEIMLAKDWFVAALTAEQKAELEALI